MQDSANNLTLNPNACSNPRHPNPTTLMRASPQQPAPVMPPPPLQPHLLRVPLAWAARLRVSSPPPLGSSGCQSRSQTLVGGGCVKVERSDRLSQLTAPLACAYASNPSPPEPHPTQPRAPDPSPTKLMTLRFQEPIPLEPTTTRSAFVCGG